MIDKTSKAHRDRIKQIKDQWAEKTAEDLVIRKYPSWAQQKLIKRGVKLILKWFPKLVAGNPHLPDEYKQ
jgi:hypothetical protein